MAVFLIRTGVVLLMALAVGLAAVPLLVLIDLLDGGTGFGLCPDGLELCDKPYSTAAELGILLTVALFATVLAMRFLVRISRRLSDESYQATT